MLKKKTINIKRNTWIKLTLIIVIVVIGLDAGYFIHNKLTSKTSGSSTSSKSVGSSENAPNNIRKGSSYPQSTLDIGNNTSSNSKNSSSNTLSNSRFQVQIVSYSVSSGNLHIGDVITGTQKGICTLTANKSGQASLKLGASVVKQDINDYDCGVFNISTNKFPVSGNWTILLTVNNNGASASSSVNVNI